MSGMWKRVMVEPLRHRQTKEAATDMFDLQPPRHISTPLAPVASGDGVNAPPVTPYQGLDHFGLTVKDIDAVAAEIKAKGWSVDIAHEIP